MKKMQDEFLRGLKKMTKNLQENYKNKLRQMNEEQQIKFLEELLEKKRKKLNQRNSHGEDGSELASVSLKKKK